MEDTVTIVHKQETSQGSCYVCKKSKKEEKRRRENNNKNKTKKRNKTEAFNCFFQFTVPLLKEMGTDRLMHRQKHIDIRRVDTSSRIRLVIKEYTMKEMVLPEDEPEIFDENLESRLADTNWQLKKWLLRWKPAKQIIA